MCKICKKRIICAISVRDTGHTPHSSPVYQPTQFTNHQMSLARGDECIYSYFGYHQMTQEYMHSAALKDILYPLSHMVYAFFSHKIITNISI